MDTIKNAASAAGAALGYGQSGEEPVKGQEGKGTAATPYDAGNSSAATADKAMGASPALAVEPVNGVVGSGTALSPYDAGNADDQQLGSDPADIAATTEIKPLESAVVVDAAVKEDQVVASTNIAPLATTAEEVDKDTAAGKDAKAVDTVLQDTTIKPLNPTTTSAPAVDTDKPLPADGAADKPLPSTPAKAKNITIETPASAGSASKRERIKEKMGSLKGKLLHRKA